MLCKSAFVALLSTVCVQSQNLHQSGEAAAEAAQAAREKAAVGEKAYAEAMAAKEKRKAIMNDYLADTKFDIVLPWTVQEQATHVSGQDAETTLSKLLSGRSKDRVDEFKTALAPMYRALPKDREGLIEQRAARYTLHRLFVKRHNWFIKGLEPNRDVWHQNATNHSITDWVPAFLFNHMKKDLSLDDLAALAAAIEDLIRQESDSTLEDVYKAFNLSHSTNLWEAHMAISANMVLFLGQGAWTLERPAKLIESFAKTQAFWRDTEDWFLNLENEHLPEEVHTPVDFAATADTVNDIAMRYGSYNDAECQKLKSHMKGTWSRAETTGRIRLVDFYKLGIETEWDLLEKVEYLRYMGALDESNASAPMVIIPNYIGAMPNCLQATKMFAICCRNECEDYLTKIEAEIEAATASPQRIADLVRSMSPRELSPQLLGRLDSMAAAHGGQVHLHGRLFAQWMHHVFPNECPYPHAAGASDATPDQWMLEGQEVAASEEERKRHVAAESCSPEQAAAEWVVELPWSDEEELLSFETRAELEELRAASPWTPALLLLALGAVLTAARTPRELRQKYAVMARINQRLILVGVITVLAFASNAVNRVLVMFIVLSGLALKLITSASSSCSVPKLDIEKVTV